MRRVQNNPESSDEPWQLSNRRVMWAASWFRRSPYGSSREHCSEGSKRRNRHHLWETVRMIKRGIWPETSTKWQRRNCGSERMSPKQSVRLSNRQKHGGIRTQLVTGNSLRCFRCFSVFLFLFFSLENHWGRQSRSGVKCNKALDLSNHDGKYKIGGQQKGLKRQYLLWDHYNIRNHGLWWEIQWGVCRFKDIILESHQSLSRNSKSINVVRRGQKGRMRTSREKCQGNQCKRLLSGGHGNLD